MSAKSVGGGAGAGGGGGGGTLRRELGVFGATMMGLGSIVGTGIFVSIAMGVALAGPSVVVAIALAAALAVCNALSSAQLAANHPTSGGTYEYGYVYLRPWLGFSAGWMFLCAKSASAATAALGFAGYVLVLAGMDGAGADGVGADGGGPGWWRTGLALGAVVALVGLVLSGVRRSSAMNVVIVSVTLGALGVFVLAGLGSAWRNWGEHFAGFFVGAAGEGGGGGGGSVLPRLLEATALMFVAYTGYGRIATMGEEVREPRRTIPRAIVLTLIVSAAVYAAVGLVGIGAVGPAVFGGVGAGAEQGAPLAAVSSRLGWGAWVGVVVSVGAVTAMLGVLLNLILGLSRVALAMGRRGDLPRAFGRVNAAGTTPTAAVLLVGGIVLGLAAVGSVKLAWSFSAFTVLVYYAVTNLAAIRLPRAQRLYHPAVSWVGLAGCLGLAFWVEARVWAFGLGVLGAGLAVRWVVRRVGAGE